MAEEENLVARIEAAQGELDRIERDGAQLGDAARAAQQYRTELVAARKALRDVQGNLRRDIDMLSSRVTFANIVVMPIIVGLVALGLAWRQRQRRRATQIAGGLRAPSESDV